MCNRLDLLVGATVDKIIKIHDYWQLILDIGIINCYNPMIFYKHKS